MPPTPSLPKHSTSEQPRLFEDAEEQAICIPAPKCVQAAVCPICSAELYERRQEVGALTNQGLRVESSLYHLNCVTLMLAHRGAVLSREKGGAPVQISWGLSPVTRKPVDGFLKMPTIDDRQSWVDFVDWNSNGKISVDDLAVVVGAILPIDEQATIGFLRETFEIKSDVVSEQVLTLRVFPYLESECKDLLGTYVMCTTEPAGERKSLSNATPFKEAAVGLRLLNFEVNPYSLRAASTQCSLVARVFIEQEMCGLIGACSKPSSLSYVEARRRAAVATASFEHIAQKDSIHFIRATSLLLASADDDTRRMAAEVMQRIAAKGDRNAIAELLSLFRHDSIHVRQTAMQLLVHIAIVGNARVMQAVLSQLHDADPRVRAAAAETLGRVVEKGNPTAIQAIYHQLGDSDPIAKRAAELVFPDIAKGDARLIDKLCTEVLDEDWGGRLRAIKALGTIAETGDQRAIKILCEVIEDTRPQNSHSLKQSALWALANVSDRNNSMVFGVVSAAVHDKDCAVAEAAIRSFPRIVEKGNRRAAKALAHLFSDKMSSPFLRALRLLALEALAQMGEGGDAYIFGVIAARFRDSDLEVRTAAVRAAGKVAKPKDYLALRALDNVLQSDQDALVKREAARAMEAIAGDAQDLRPPPQCCIAM